jgi:hypothetical protein
MLGNSQVVQIICCGSAHERDCMHSSRRREVKKRDAVRQSHPAPPLDASVGTDGSAVVGLCASLPFPASDSSRRVGWVAFAGKGELGLAQSVNPCDFWHHSTVFLSLFLHLVIASNPEWCLSSEEPRPSLDLVEVMDESKPSPNPGGKRNAPPKSVWDNVSLIPFWRTRHHDGLPHGVT